MVWLQTQAPFPAQIVNFYHSGGRVGRHFEEFWPKLTPEKWIENRPSGGRMYLRCGTAA